MKALFGASALGLLAIIGTGTPAAAQDINIYVQGDDGVKMERGHDGKGRGSDMHGARGHHEMHGSRGRHDMHGSRGHGERGGDRDRHGRDGGHGRGMGHALRLIELYDRDGDDKVTQAEIDETRAERLAAFDADGDGTLTLQEYEALWLDAMRERMVDRFQSHDDDGDGAITVEEFSDSTSRLVLRGDRNGDGALGLDDAQRGDGPRGHGHGRDRDDDRE